MTRTFAREMTPAEQRGALLRRLYERLGVDQVPPHPSKRAVRELVDRRLRAAPLSVGEQMCAMLLICDHTDGDVDHWTARFQDGRTHETARVAILKALMFMSQGSAREVRVEAKDVDLERIVEHRILFDAIHEFGRQSFSDDVLGVLVQLSGHELETYWEQAERCRRRAMLAAGLMWMPVLVTRALAPLVGRAVEVMRAEPSRVSGILFAPLLEEPGGDATKRALADLAATAPGPPRGVDRLKVRSASLRSGGGWRRVTYGIQHPEEVWMCGYIDLDVDGLIEDDHVQVTSVAPVFAPESTVGYELTELDATEFHRTLAAACEATAAARESPGYAALAVLGMLEGTTPPDRVGDPRRRMS